MKYQVRYDDGRDVLMLELLGEMSREEILELFDNIDRLLQGKPRRYILADLSAAPIGNPVDSQTRQVYRECAKKVDIQRSAIVGASPVMRIMAKIIVAVMGRSSTAAFFATREEASSWLTERQPE